MNIDDKNIGIIAGNGVLPIKVSQKAQKEGYKVFSVCFDCICIHHRVISKE